MIDAEAADVSGTAIDALEAEGQATTRRRPSDVEQRGERQNRIDRSPSSISKSKASTPPDGSMTSSLTVISNS